ncbi:hypothetical protein Q7A53_05590 [Halobacillus rhizosphaerae]|uniref:hypothetical protein n=1 Tax=Halobacillus rhizosphaerae TaxID=3064889 RepID=UPI00398ABF73
MEFNKQDLEKFEKLYDSIWERASQLIKHRVMLDDKLDDSLVRAYFEYSEVGSNSISFEGEDRWNDPCIINLTFEEILMTDEEYCNKISKDITDRDEAERVKKEERKKRYEEDLRKRELERLAELKAKYEND